MTENQAPSQCPQRNASPKQPWAAEPMDCQPFSVRAVTMLKSADLTRDVELVQLLPNIWQLRNRGRIVKSCLFPICWKPKLNHCRLYTAGGGKLGMMVMVKTLLAVCSVCAALTGPALAEDRVTLGWGRLFTNDALGDSKDRWRTGAYTVSRVRGYSWSADKVTAMGDILEFRARGETIAPVNLASPALDDRRYAAMLSFGMHTHFDWKGNEVSLGGDLVILGPQTGISRFQSFIHNLLNMPKPQIAANELGNAVYPTLVAELGRTIALGDNARIRPFVEAQAGLETFVRVGGDLVIGKLGQDDLMLRDPGTGQRYRAVEGTRDTAVSFVIGGDFAQVFDSNLLPSGENATLSESRSRLRAGVHWQGKKASAFYGLSYLGPEFEQQPEGQVVGALNLNLKF